MVHASTPVCRASNVRRRRYKSSRCGTRFHPSVQGVQHEACAWAENYGFIQKIVALHLQPHWQKLQALPNEYTPPQWIAARIGRHGHGSLLGDDVVYAVYSDYSDLPSETWKQTARSLWLALLSESGVTPTTADQIKFDVFVTSLQDAPAWREQKKLRKTERASQNVDSAAAVDSVAEVLSTSTADTGPATRSCGRGDRRGLSREAVGFSSAAQFLAQTPG